MRNKLLIVSTILLIFSCKKDRIKDEYSDLIGTWKWTQSLHTFGWCNNEEQSEILTPENQGMNFKMEIYENGIIKFYQDNEFLEKDRVVFSKYSGGVCDNLVGGQMFEIDLNNDKEQLTSFNGCVNKDSIYIGVFPLTIQKVGCENYINYFIRE